MFFRKTKTKPKIVEHNEILLNGKKLNYRVKFSNRRSIEVRIGQNREIVVSAPTHIKTPGVEKFLHKKSDWIIKTLKNYDGYFNITAPKNFENGENIFYLGKEYELVIKQNLVSKIELNEDNFIIHTPYTKNKTKIKNLVLSWYKNQITEVFAERLEECLKLTRSINITCSEKIDFRKMNRRWGTCTADNQIILNSKLIFLDLKYIDYVILHELCHFRQKNHSSRYYALLLSVCPNYKNIRRDLNHHIIESFL